ncbi:MAG: FAD-dependent oxidoreductase [Clostridia bacterium]|nr:FAD-dependent oxidoreductase [Clostridia bacterium]
MEKQTINTNVLVVGSGPAGISAAYTAAKNGAKVILVEQCGDVGGISTTGLMSHWTGSCASSIYHEILRRSAERNEGEYHNKITPIIDPEKLKTLYLEMLCEAGVTIMLYTFACDAIMDGHNIKGVSVVNKSGFTDIYADVIIDASGDGDIAYKSGAEFIKGRESDGKMQPVTIMFKVGGVDYDRAVFPGSFETQVETEKGELQNLARKNLPFPAGHVLLYKTTLPGTVTCNMTNCIEIDGTNADDLTKATLICRNQMNEIVKFLREYAPGYENCYIVSSASLIGVRETRHFKGEYTLTEEDILNAKVFDDYVVKDAYFNFDVHNITGSGLDATGVQKKFKQKKGYTIPYRCLLPQKIENLLLCGRNISGTHMAHSNFRVMPICAGLGEAAGAAAAIAVKNNIPVRKVTASEIRKLIF